MRYIFQEEKIDTVLHFAAQSHVGMSQMFLCICCWECVVCVESLYPFKLLQLTVNGV